MNVTCRLKIDSGNEAFDLDAESEIARILRHVADRVEQNGSQDLKLMDVNGNAVGTFHYKRWE